MSNMEEISLFCPERGVIINLVLSSEDATRAKNDLMFTHELIERYFGCTESDGAPEQAGGTSTQVKDGSVQMEEESTQGEGTIKQAKGVLIQVREVSPQGRGTLMPAEEALMQAKVTSVKMKESFSPNAEANNSEEVTKVDNSGAETMEGIESEGSYKWSDALVMSFLQTYKSKLTSFEKGKVPHKKLWEKIAKCLEEQGYTVTGVQCAAKLRSLRKTYKAIKEHNMKTGNDRRNWKFFDIVDEIFTKSAWINPTGAMDNSGKSLNQSIPTIRLIASNNKPSTDLSPNLCAKRLLADRIRQKEEFQKEKRRRYKDYQEAERRRHKEVVELQKKQLEIEDRRLKMEERRLLVDELLVKVLSDITQKERK